MIDAAKGRRRLVRMGRETLARSGAKLIGVVLNRVPSVTRFGYGGFYGRGDEDCACAGRGPSGIAVDRHGRTIVAGTPRHLRHARLSTRVASQSMSR